MDTIQPGASFCAWTHEKPDADYKSIHVTIISIIPTGSDETHAGTAPWVRLAVRWKPRL